MHPSSRVLPLFRLNLLLALAFGFGLPNPSHAITVVYGNSALESGATGEMYGTFVEGNWTEHYSPSGNNVSSTGTPSVTFSESHSYGVDTIDKGEMKIDGTIDATQTVTGNRQDGTVTMDYLVSGYAYSEFGLVEAQSLYFYTTYYTNFITDEAGLFWGSFTVEWPSGYDAGNLDAGYLTWSLIDNDSDEVLAGTVTPQTTNETVTVDFGTVALDAGYYALMLKYETYPNSWELVNRSSIQIGRAHV